MTERFSEAARAVVAQAGEEARLMRHGHLGTEHLLVALALAGDPVLARYGLSGESARGEVVRAVGLGDDASAEPRQPTPAARDALDAALHEAMKLGQERVEPAHLLLGVVRQSDGVARRILLAAGATPRELREEVVRELAARAAPPPVPSPDSDGRQLLDILARDGAVAAWLRARGVDERAVRAMLGDE